MRFVRADVKEGRLGGGQQTSWKKWIKEVEKDLVESHLKCQSLKALVIWLGSLTFGATHFLKD